MTALRTSCADKSPPESGPVHPLPAIAVVEPLMRVVRICCACDGVLYLTPMLFYSGISNAFWSGIFTRQMYVVGSIP